VGVLNALRLEISMKLLKAITAAFCAVAALMAAPVQAAPPTELKISAALSVGPDEPWDGSFLAAWDKVRGEKPHGLSINAPTYTEGVWGDSAEAVARLYARKGYDIIWMHSSYSDQVKRIKDKYPNIMFVVVGSGNEGLGGNQYWVYMRNHESAYLQGVVAGMTTKTKTLGFVGTFPADDVLDAANGYFMGAESVNPGIKKKIAFVESWWDPPMAREASMAQIAAGADNIMMSATAFEACREKRIQCHGAYKNWIPDAPDAVMTSFVSNWEPALHWIIDEWYKVRSTDGKFAGNTDKKWFSMADGGTNAALNDALPADVKAKVEAVRQDIISGKLQVPLVVEPIKGD